MKTVVAVVCMILVAGSLFGQQGNQSGTGDHGGQQTGRDQNLQVREDLLVITELGRLFGFIVTMHESEPALAISRAQAQELWQISEELRRIQRLEPALAERHLLQIEDTILNPAQLLYTDRLFSGRGESQESGSETRSSPRSNDNDSSSGDFSSISSYLAGGRYNPFLDQGRPMGDNFENLRNLLQTLR